MTAPASPEAGRLTGEALAEIEACGDVRASAACVPALIAEVRRLRALVEAAFREGWETGAQVAAPAPYASAIQAAAFESHRCDFDWRNSATRDSLAGIESGSGDA